MKKKRTRLRSVCGHSYPVGESLARVKEAGGLSKMTAEQVAALDIKRVAPGGWCDDMPEECRPAFLRRGKIEEVEVDVSVPPITETVKKRRKKRGN